MDKNCHVEPVIKNSRPDDLAKASLAVLAVGGMSCVNCALRVQNGLLTLEGVLDAQVNLGLGMAEVFYDSRSVNTDQMIAAVANAGNDGRHNYQAYVWNSYNANEAATR